MFPLAEVPSFIDNGWELLLLQAPGLFCYLLWSYCRFRKDYLFPDCLIMCGRKTPKDKDDKFTSAEKYSIAAYILAGILWFAWLLSQESKPEPYEPTIFPSKLNRHGMYREGRP